MVTIPPARALPPCESYESLPRQHGGPLHQATVETHGTGTGLGDPTETRALAESFPVRKTLTGIKANVNPEAFELPVS